MILKQREKMFAIVLSTALGLLAADQYLLTPYLKTQAKLESEAAVLAKQNSAAQRLLRERQSVDLHWQQLLSSGLKLDPVAAESAALHALRTAAQNNRVALQSFKPEHLARVGDFSQIRLQTTGTGTTTSIAGLLWEIESSKTPLKVNDLRLTTRKDGADDLSFAITVSTVCFTPAPPAKAPTPTPSRSSGKGAAR